MTPNKNPTGKPELDARTFQGQLGSLATTIALKVQREAAQLGFKPAYAVADIYFLLRQAQQTYSTFFFMNADERRQKDVDWRAAYSVVMLPLVRTMIDCLYNVTAILKNPGPTGHLFRASGYRLMLLSLDRDALRYGGDPKWDEWIARQRHVLDFDMRTNGFVEAEVRASKALWPTLSRYLKVSPGATPTAHQAFLEKLTLGFWQEYSGISHATFQGLLPIAVFLAPNDLPHEDRPKVDDTFETMLSIHMPRVCAILLCILTETQVHFRFDGANINKRLHEIWNALIIAPEIKELYDERYANLMKEKGINPK
jgi:hypothetical protein